MLIFLTQFTPFPRSFVLFFISLFRRFRPRTTKPNQCTKNDRGDDYRYANKRIGQIHRHPFIFYKHNLYANWINALMDQLDFSGGWSFSESPGGPNVWSFVAWSHASASICIVVWWISHCSASVVWISVNKRSLLKASRSPTTCTVSYTHLTLPTILLV